MKTCVFGTRVYKAAKAELFDIAEPLKIGMLNQVVNEFILYRDEPIHRVVNDFLFVQNLQEKLAYYT